MTKTFLVFIFSVFSFLANSQTVDFTFQSTNGLFCSPATIQFTQNCTGNPTGFIWYLGNGLKSFSPSPTTSYITEGTYAVRLVAIYPQGAREITKTITITPTVNPVLVADRVFICQPGPVNLTATTGGNIVSYTWNFGDASGMVTTTTNSTSHSYAGFGNFPIIVTATDAGGCSGSDTLSIDVMKVAITATATPDSGCIPVNSVFSASAILPINSSISNYSWDFGDGSAPVSTTNGTVNHTYSVADSFFAKVSITTNEGCTNTLDLAPLAFGTPPTNHIAYTPKTTVCGSETPKFIAKATNANSYRWNFGDGTVVTVKDTVTQHKYATLGTKTVTVTPLFNDCPGTPISFPINVVGVIAKYIYSNTCADKRTFAFNNSTVGNKPSIEWNFGDGSPIATTTNAAHTFPASGQFVTLLTVRDTTTGCVDTFSRTVYTSRPTLVNPDVSICKNTSTTFTIDDNYTNPAATYIWNVVGKIVSTNVTPTAVVNANILGNFNNFVVISNGSSSTYCRDTVRLNNQILVRGPQLNYASPANICFADTMNIINKSQAFVPSDSVTLWFWNYGNSLSNDTVYQPGPILYNAPRSYNIKLTGIDINGCKDSLVKRVIVNPLPFLRVLPAKDTLCLGQTDSLFAFHSNNVLWTPATGLSCTTCDTVIANPTVTTQYIISATTPANCSIRDSILLTVIPPFTAVSAKANPYICLNEQDTLDVNPKNKVIVWSPATGLSNVNIYNPVVRPTQTTTYTATLTDSVGCFTSTVDVTVFLKSLPRVDAGPDRVLPYATPFTINPVYSTNIRSYMWSPTGFLNCVNCPNPTGTALNSETYTIKVVSDSGCVASDAILIAIECKDANILMPKAFTPNNDGLNDFYFPITRGIKTITRFAVYNREGQVLYEARNFLPNNKSFSWNGEYKGARLPTKAYVFVVEAVCETGEKLSKGGSFVLLR